MTTVPVPVHTRVRFGVFEADLLTRELFRDGHKIALQEQPFQVLEMLLERRGDLVTRDELRTRLWSDTEFGDFDIGLNKAVAKLREALRDDASAPRFIETLPKRGYRFIGDLGPVVVPAPALENRKAGGTLRLRSGQAVALHVWLAIVVVSVAVVAAFLMLRPKEKPPAGRAVVAVLPFRNISIDRTQDYFSDGLTVELITMLSRVHPSQLGVIAPTSVMAYRDQTRPVTNIGAELGAGYVVEGTVRRDENRVRVTARLTRVDDQTQVWADAFDRDPSDAFRVQSDLAEAIAQAVRVKILPRERTSLRNPPTANREAYDEYLKGVYLQGTEAKAREALEHFERAVELDPEFASAWAGLSNAALWVKPRATYMARAEEAAKRAVALNPNLAEAHAAVASIEMIWHWNWARAGEEFARAIALQPTEPEVLTHYATYLAATGRLDEAIVASRQATELDPRSPLIRQQLGRLYYFNRQPANAIYEWNKSLELDPHFYWSHLFLSFVHRDRGDYKAWFESQKRAFQISGMPDSFIQRFEDHAAKNGYQETEDALLQMKERFAMDKPVESLALGIEHAKRGNNEKAIQWIEKALVNRPNDAIYLNVEPAFDGLRGDPRFQKIVARLGLR